MMVYDESAVRLLVAAERLVSEDDQLCFAAETVARTALMVARTALMVAGGDVVRATQMLYSMEEFVGAALLKLRELQCSPPLLDMLANGKSHASAQELAGSSALARQA